VIKTDGSWGRAPTSLTGVHRTSIKASNASAMNVPGSVFTIPETQARIAGANLFHSFARFNVGAGDAALFTTETATLQNVISRVTGGEPSTILGLLRLQAANGSHPDFYFINPAGVLFGAGAQIDVPAGFHVSTADRLRFADGFVWSTSTPSGSTLTTAPVQAFGFVGQHPATAVRFDNLDADAVARARPRIELNRGAVLDIAAGAVSFDSVDVFVPEGSLRIASAGQQPADIFPKGGTSTLLTGRIDANGASLSTTGKGSIPLARRTDGLPGQHD
jgi:filamentous hemagglutinin family protein